jgi:acyl-coenzyme A synthetase/AMP-(fatty) acid ligase
VVEGWPERIEIFDHLPKTASGKIQKYVLRKRLRGTASASPNPGSPISG